MLSRASGVSFPPRAAHHDMGGRSVFYERWVIVEDSEIKNLLRIREPERREPGVKSGLLRSEVGDSQAGRDLHKLFNCCIPTEKEEGTTYTCSREDDDVLRLTEQLRHVLQRVILWQLISLDQFPCDTNL